MHDDRAATGRAREQCDGEHPHPVPLVRMLTRAACFSRWLDMRSKESAFAALKQSNALEQPAAAKLVFDDSSIVAAPMGGAVRT